MKPFLIALKNASAIVDKFGGVLRMSRLTGISYYTIVGWVRSGVIPEKYRPWLLAVAHREGIAHTAYDYIAHLVTPTLIAAEAA